MKSQLESSSKRIAFIEPRGSKDNVFSKSITWPLLGPIYLATILKKEGYDVKVYNENILGRDINLHELDVDVLCLTGLTTTIDRAYEIAIKFRALNPQGKVIIGGIHASFMKEESGRYADYVVSGEGESVIADLIKNGSKEKFIDAHRIEDMNKLPIPDFSLLQNNKRMPITPIMTSRGCPFGCNFCSVTAMFGRKFRTRSIEKVVEEFRRIKTKGTFFYDDNLCADKKRAAALFDALKRNNPNNVVWTGQVRCDAANDDSLLRKMADSGCVKVYIGFESVNQKTLDAYNKSQSVKDIKMAIKKFHDYGIGVHGMFVLGSDEDDKHVFDATTEFSNSNEIDSVQYMILTPGPGTPFFARLESENRLLHRMWEYYDGMHVVFQPKLLSPTELQQGMIDCYKDFYTYGKALNGAVNIVYDKAADLCASAFNRAKRYFPRNWDTTLLGKIIIHRWMKTNKSYLGYLRNRKN
ncbi:MAG: radical SAM protein [archaeon]